MQQELRGAGSWTNQNNLDNLTSVQKAMISLPASYCVQKGGRKDLAITLKKKEEEEEAGKKATKPELGN